MPRWLRAPGRLAVFFLAVACSLGATPCLGAEIFKCVAKDGLPLFQNFPCDIDSLGSLPSASSVTTPSAPLKPGTRDGLSSKLPTASSSSKVAASELQVGMSADKVRMLWGEPVEMVADEPAEGGPTSIWRYADGRSVQFDHLHHVVEVQR
jgi:hypothetical protein